MILRPLSDRPVNDNYDPPRPWSCRVLAQHACSGGVIGFLGALPVCLAGAGAEQRARMADRVRAAAFIASSAAEVARERAWESTHS